MPSGDLLVAGADAKGGVLMQLDDDGDYQWMRTYADDRLRSIDIDAGGNILATGCFETGPGRGIGIGIAQLDAFGAPDWGAYLHFSAPFGRPLRKAARAAFATNRTATCCLRAATKRAVTTSMPRSCCCRPTAISPISTSRTGSTTHWRFAPKPAPVHSASVHPWPRPFRYPCWSDHRAPPRSSRPAYRRSSVRSRDSSTSIE